MSGKFGGSWPPLSMPMSSEVILGVIPKLLFCPLVLPQLDRPSARSDSSKYRPKRICKFSCMQKCRSRKKIVLSSPYKIAQALNHSMVVKRDDSNNKIKISHPRALSAGMGKISERFLLNTDLDWITDVAIIIGPIV